MNTLQELASTALLMNANEMELLALPLVLQQRIVRKYFSHFFREFVEEMVPIVLDPDHAFKDMEMEFLLLELNRFIIIARCCEIENIELEETLSEPLMAILSYLPDLENILEGHVFVQFLSCLFYLYTHVPPLAPPFLPELWADILALLSSSPHPPLICEHNAAFATTDGIKP